MTIEITFNYTRCRKTEYTYTILLDGEIVGAASTYRDAEMVAQEVAARNDIALLNGAIAALEQVDAAIQIEIEGMTLTAPTNELRCPSDARSLLAQCAAVLAQCAAAFDALLGNAPAGGGILDEVRQAQRDARRVLASLAEAGW